MLNRLGAAKLMPIVFLSLVAFSIVTSLPDSSTAPLVVMLSL